MYVSKLSYGILSVQLKYVNEKGIFVKIMHNRKPCDYLKKILFIAAAFFFIFAGILHGQEVSPVDTVGVHENTGRIVPLNLTFRDERGTEIRLGDIINKPTILTLVYYQCSHICPQMLFGLSEVLSKIKLVPGRDYKIITLSFDETDTPEDARTQKVNYIKAINADFPEISWKFLTGDRETIEKISDAVGIKYRQVMHGFVHPEVLIFLSPEGKITRYLHVSTSAYGVQYPVLFSPVEFTGAITDASKGIISARITRTPFLCFPHEPEQQAKFYHLLAVLGAITLLVMLFLFVYLRMTTKKFSEGKK
jgi:protein SCO1